VLFEVLGLVAVLRISLSISFTTHAGAATESVSSDTGVSCVSWLRRHDTHRQASMQPVREQWTVSERLIIYYIRPSAATVRSL